MRILKILLGTVVGVYLLAVAGLMYMETELVFYPKDEVTKISDYKDIGTPEEIWWTLPKGNKVQSWYWQATGGKPTFVAFHGQSRTLGYRSEKWYNGIAKAGYGLLMVGYSHNAGGGGEPAEDVVLADSLDVLRQMKERFGLFDDNIVIYGESLGSGVATYVAMQTPNAKALILEAPFDSTADVAAARYPYMPIKLVMRNQFRSYERMPSVKAPVLIVHGTSDVVVPLSHGERLFSFVTSAYSHMEVIEGAEHKTLYDNGMAGVVDKFIKSLP